MGAGEHRAEVQKIVNLQILQQCTGLHEALLSVSAGFKGSIAHAACLSCLIVGLAGSLPSHTARKSDVNKRHCLTSSL